MQRQPYFFIKEAGKAFPTGTMEKISSRLVTLFLAAFNDGYSTYAGGKAPGGATSPARPPRNFHPVASR